MTHGTIVEWYKKEGDQIKEGDPIFQVDTEKTTIDVEAEVSGTLKQILVHEDEEVPVGQIVALIQTES